MNELDDSSIPGIFDYARILYRRKWVIVVVAVAVALGFIASDHGKQKTYGATALVVFPDTSVSASDPGALDTQMRILESPAVTAVVRKQYPRAEGASVQQQGASNVVAVTVKGDDPSVVGREADAYVTAFSAYRDREQTIQFQKYSTSLNRQIQQLQHKIQSLQASETHQLAGINQNTASGASQAAALAGRLDTQIRVLSANEGVYQSQLNNLAPPSAEGSIQLLSKAGPGTLTGPKQTRDGLLGLGGGAALGVLLALGLEYFDQSVRRRASLERLLPRLPVLGAIPPVRRWIGAESRPVPALNAPRSSASECFRALWNSIRVPAVGNRISSLLVTSARPKEGKTMVAANLGVVTARAGVPTVIVDANLRSPSMHGLFGLPNMTGLSSLLLGQASLDDVLRDVPNVAGLSVITAGPSAANPWELLSSARFTRLMEELGGQRMIIIDAPAALASSEASALASRSDATLLVASAKRSNQRDLKRAVAGLEQVGTKILGTVLTSATASDFMFRGGSFTERWLPRRDATDTSGAPLGDARAAGFPQLPLRAPTK